MTDSLDVPDRVRQDSFGRELRTRPCPAHGLATQKARNRRTYSSDLARLVRRAAMANTGDDETAWGRPFL